MVSAADASALVNLVDLGAIALVETTLVTQREEPVAFDATHRSPYANQLTGNLETVLGVVDVYEARRNGILPLPAHVRGSDGAVQVIEYRPAVHSHEARTATNRPENAQHKGRKPVPPRVQQWKNSLLDLSLRNKLIKFSDRASVALSVPREQLGRFEDLVNESTALTLRPADALDDVHFQRGITTGAELPDEYRTGLMLERKAVYCDTPTAGYQTRMRNLAYKARTIVEDTGANNLYLALGSLVWSIDGEPMRSPLVLVPVQLRSRARSGVYTVALDESGTSTPNFCLLEKLRQLHGLEVPSLAEPADDGSGIDLDAALESVRVAVAEAGLGFRVEPTADLAILQFAKFRLWKDLDENWEQHLRAYLDMAAHGTSTLAGIATSARRPSVADRHREKVAEVLRSQGLVVSTDVGLSDFKVDLAVALPSDPARPVMAVLLDGPGWARRGTVGDRDGLPVEVLSRMMRWPAVERLWLPAWMKDPAGEASRLVAAAHAAAVAPVGSPAAGDSPNRA